MQIAIKKTLKAGAEWDQNLVSNHPTSPKIEAGPFPEDIFRTFPNIVLTKKCYITFIDQNHFARLNSN